jgi:hypothetical protein
LARRPMTHSTLKTAQRSADEWYELYSHTFDLLEEARTLLRECVDGTVDDCTKWNRRTRAFLKRK